MDKNLQILVGKGGGAFFFTPIFLKGLEYFYFIFFIFFFEKVLKIINYILYSFRELPFSYNILPKEPNVFLGHNHIMSFNIYVFF